MRTILIEKGKEFKTETERERKGRKMKKGERKKPSQSKTQSNVYFTPQTALPHSLQLDL